VLERFAMEALMSNAEGLPEDLIPLTPRVFHIMLALVDEEQHGYRIMKEVETRSEGKVRIGPGTLYEAIQRLVRNGLIEESSERPDAEMDDQRRRYYRLTDFGRRVLQAESDRLAALVGFARTKNLVREAKSA
jgi:DNA-binding PadR family transcriptional regulator